PLVFEVRDLWPELPIVVGAIKNPIIIKLATWLEIYTYKNSKRIVGLSPGMCDGITRHGIAEDKVTLATNSCDTQLFDVPASIGIDFINDSLDFLKGRKLVVYTGTFGLINNVEYLAYLASHMKFIDANICFVAIGDGMMKESVVKKAQELGVLDINFYILPPVPKTQIVKLLSAADLSVSLFGPVPEMWHNSANKLFDALAASTPIAINYGGWQESFIIEYDCGLVLSSNDYGTSASAISNFLNDQNRYQQAISKCSFLAYNVYSRDIMVKRIENTLIEAIND
ncbi:MAG: glycosyltransferase involved in cell wall biosynthesis, partial [Psychromonas sp.]|uniref:glycosyltransferase family 4 protein n=1 Tax=Psychromonas sp. TaxID=1884585 RepID=UPI0039E2926F